MRVLGRTRISRSTLESTSIERQREIITSWAETNDHEIVGWAEDVDVSGAVDPFEAPALAPRPKPGGIVLFGCHNKPATGDPT